MNLNSALLHANQRTLMWHAHTPMRCTPLRFLLDSPYRDRLSALLTLHLCVCVCVCTCVRVCTCVYVCVSVCFRLLLQAIGQFSCALYNIPWQCPIPSFVPSTCDCQCDKCNTVSHRDTCTACLADSECGFCQESPSQLSSCLEGSSSGPSGDGYECMKWNYGSASNCTGI